MNQIQKWLASFFVPSMRFVAKGETCLAELSQWQTQVWFAGRFMQERTVVAVAADGENAVVGKEALRYATLLHHHYHVLSPFPDDGSFDARTLLLYLHSLEKKLIRTLNRKSTFITWKLLFPTELTKLDEIGLYREAREHGVILESVGDAASYWMKHIMGVKPGIWVQLGPIHTICAFWNGKKIVRVETYGRGWMQTLFELRREWREQLHLHVADDEVVRILFDQNRATHTLRGIDVLRQIPATHRVPRSRIDDVWQKYIKSVHDALRAFWENGIPSAQPQTADKTIQSTTVKEIRARVEEKNGTQKGYTFVVSGDAAQCTKVAEAIRELLQHTNGTVILKKEGS